MRSKVLLFSLSRCVEAAFKRAEYDRGENGVVVAQVPEVLGSFAQGGGAGESG